MASGTPVVGPNEGGTPLTFENNKQGSHYPSHDQNAAVNTIMAVIDAGEKMRKVCVPHARKFAWERVICNLEKKYFKVLDRATQL